MLVFVIRVILPYMLRLCAQNADDCNVRAQASRFVTAA
jgi:hypothetical protein